MTSQSETRSLRMDFGREIYFQCQAAIFHHEEMKRYLLSAEHHERTLHDRDHIGLGSIERARIHIEAIITHAANLSRIFFAADSQRAEMLRDIFSLAADSPLKNRKLRNAFHHYDERLDAQRKKVANKEITESVYKLTFISADSSGSFQVQWHDGKITDSEAYRLMREIHQLSSRTEQLLKLTPGPSNPHPFRLPPAGYCNQVSAGRELIDHAEYLRQTGQDPNMPYPEPDDSL